MKIKSFLRCISYILCAATFIYKNIIHYGVTNIPSLVARSATEALCHNTLPYVLKLASEGVTGFEKDKNLKSGIQIQEGEEKIHL